MRKDPFKYLLLLLLLSMTVFSIYHCKKPFLPPAIRTGNNYLVVDGIINTGTDGVTVINLNRTRNLGDTLVTGIPELRATVDIVSSSGTAYALHDTAGNGIYASAPLSLDITQSYRIAITTSDGRKYQSDLVPCKTTPAIDSFYWEQPHDLTFYLDTHDPSNTTNYYRWDYTETWQHNSNLQTVWYVKDHTILPTDSTTQTSECWTDLHSSTILLASSATLGQDRIDHFPVNTILNGDDKLDNKYSILVRQYALTADAYNYWQVIQKTSQNLGSLFDLQPTQLTGNIHCTSNPDEPVIGFASASSIREARIFLYNTNMTDWRHNSLSYSCDTLGIPVNQSDYRIYLYPDTNYAPYYFISNGPLILASRRCLDCTLFGGTNIKPSYWK